VCFFARIEWAINHVRGGTHMTDELQSFLEHVGSAPLPDQLMWLGLAGLTLVLIWIGNQARSKKEKRLTLAQRVLSEELRLECRGVVP
jgi:hypothetical protein